MGLNAGKMDTAIGKIPKEQGELKDLAMGLRATSATRRKKARPCAACCLPSTWAARSLRPL
jgi:hypothetical protein